MLKALSNIYFIFILVILSSCSDIIEQSIEDKTISIIYPSNDSKLKYYEQNFWWSEVEFATHYKLEVVKGSFNVVDKFILDSTIKSTQFNCVLEPGKYQLRVRAENGSSHTPFTTHTFEIDTTTITIQKVILLSPVSNLNTNSSQIFFSWYELYGANEYRLQIDTTGFINENNLIYNELLTSPSSSIILNNEKQYQWRVRAESEGEYSKWSDVAYFTVDKQKPNTPQLVLPLNNSQVNSPIFLEWTDIVDADEYELYLYKQDSTSLYDNTYPKKITNSFYTINANLNNGKIYWRVRAYDKAGNKSDYSSYRSFTVK